MDKTLPIAGKFSNVKIVMGQFVGFGETKNAAASHALHNWIFSIDSDEVVSPVLLNSIKEANLHKDVVYGFERFNFYRKKRVRFSGWRKETIYRIYNRTTTEFNNKKVHEALKLDNLKTTILKGELKHYSYRQISDFNKKRALYSDLFASENKGVRKSSPLRAILSGLYVFFNTYFLRFGFLDGYRGLLISFSNASVTFIKYLKLYEANLSNNLGISLIITTHYGGEVLKETLKSVLCQAIPPDEIIINDVGIDETKCHFLVGFAKSSFIPIKYFNKEDTSFDKVVGRAKFEYLIFIEDNVVLHRRFIEDHICNAKEESYVTSRKIVLSQKQSDKIYKNKDKVVTKPAIPNHFKLLFMALVESMKRKAVQPSSTGPFSCSFFKCDYVANGLKESIVFNDEKIIDRLKDKGFKRKKLWCSGFLYQRKTRVDTSKQTVLVCLDRLKNINCGLGQVALNYGRELLSMETGSLRFDFLLPEKGFPEFEHKARYIKLNLFRRIHPGYMKAYDLCHVTHQTPSYSFGKARKNILTIHDLNFLFTKSHSKNIKYLRSLQKNIDKSDAIVFISESTKQIVLENLKIPENKIQRVIYNGVQAPKGYKQKPNWLPDKKFVFSIGQFLKKKNFLVLLPFIKLLPDDYILVIAGENDTNYGNEIAQAVKKLKLQKRVILPGGVSEADRNFLYNSCEAFLFPSIAEGFGLPVIEAMLCGKPVFCSDRTSLKEIGGEFAFFWKNFEPEEMLKVFNLGIDTFKYDGFVEKQKEYANTYTYKRNVSEYLQLYEDLLS